MLFLSSAIVLLVLGLAAVLIRNLVRLIMDRKRGILGARLRTKLVFFFLVLVLPPSLVLFYGSATIIKMTVEAVLKTPVESVTRYSQEIANEWRDFIEARYGSAGLGDFELCEYFLFLGASANSRNLNGRIPLDLARAGVLFARRRAELRVMPGFPLI